MVRKASFDFRSFEALDVGQKWQSYNVMPYIGKTPAVYIWAFSQELMCYYLAIFNTLQVPFLQSFIYA